MPTALAELLRALGAAFDDLGVRWYLFGAQAVAAYGVPRATADVDVTVELPAGGVPALLRRLEAAGFEPRVGDVDSFVAATRVLPLAHPATGFPVDVVLAGSPLEERFLSRARTTDLGSIRVPVLAPEDLVVVKLLAGRPKDVDDARGLLEEQRQALDHALVRSTLRDIELALDRSDLVPLFDRLLEDPADG